MGCGLGGASPLQLPPHQPSEWRDTSQADMQHYCLHTLGSGQSPSPVLLGPGEVLPSILMSLKILLSF